MSGWGGGAASHTTLTKDLKWRKEETLYSKTGRKLKIGLELGLLFPLVLFCGEKASQHGKKHKQEKLKSHEEGYLLTYMNSRF